jgi:isoamylase
LQGGILVSMDTVKKILIRQGTFANHILEIQRGYSLPFGARYFPEGVNFSVFSEHATSVSVVIFESGLLEPIVEVLFDELLNRTGNVWHMLMVGLPDDFRYGFRVDGPSHALEGHMFDKTKILIDPYTKGLTGGAVWGSPVMRKGESSQNRPEYLRRCFIPSTKFDWQNDRQLGIPLQDTIIYELHVRGFTIHPSSGCTYPGTFRGIIEKIPYFKELGITAIELMPINEFDELECMFSNPRTGEKLKNYWGYSSIAFFAPKSSYAHAAREQGEVEEFKEMVRELHKAGIEVILDVVFNHTAEGTEYGPTLSFRGLENSVYYMLDECGRYKNYSGCGNTLNCNHPVVRDLILNCLRYWVTEMHVDGFRFDLASILGRDQDGNVLKNPPILESIEMDPLLANTKIIAEAWDAAGLYQVGNFPSWQRWAEWNGKYRDCVRRFVRGELGMTGETASRISGSSDLYSSSGRKPYHSINYITAHDGFTLYDLVSFNYKHNEDNGEGNRDGQDENFSWNCGEEGHTQNQKIKAFRYRQIKNYITMLMLSQGTPMILSGDEFARTQRGNNNAYAQDNEMSWIDWSFKERHNGLFRFMKTMIAFRKSHSILRRSDFFDGQVNTQSGRTDISWHSTIVGKPDFSYFSRTLTFLLDGAEASPTEPDTDIYVTMNMWKDALVFRIPKLGNGKKWFCKVDTFQDFPNDIYEDNHEIMLKRQTFYRVAPYSILVLISKR